jgi:hypothetical protein
MRVIKSSSMRWVGHVAHTGGARSSYKISVGKSERKNHFEDHGEDGRIILELILEKQNGKLWTGFNWLRTGTSGGLM